MNADCHIHVALDGIWYKTALDAHRQCVREDWIRSYFQAYADRGITRLRDGGDRFGVTDAAKRIAPEYGIDYRTPIFPICRKGRYGGFIGRGFDDFEGYKALVREAAARGADFIKIMISGIMDFDHFGVITSEPLTRQEIRDMTAFAHDEGFAVMAHANGAETVIAAAEAGIDSVEHGAYQNEESLAALAQTGTVWVPTTVTIANLVGEGRYPDAVLAPLRDLHLANIRRCAGLGGLIAVGSDAGAYRVMHGEAALQERALLQGMASQAAEDRIFEKFRRR